MNSELKEQLASNDVNFDEGISRFSGNEKLYFKFLYKFINDENYNKLIKAMNDKDFENAFIYSHTLKGVAGNLSLKKIYVLSSSITECLRINDYQKAQDLLPALSEAYENIIKILRQYSEESL